MKVIHNLSTMRITSQQQAIYQVITNSTQHQNVEQIYREVRKVLPRISLATVYRNLEKLAERHMIGQVSIRGKFYFERRIDSHYHVICLSCQRVDNIDSIPASDIESFFARGTDYKLVSHELVLHGVCPSCIKSF